MTIEMLRGITLQGRVLAGPDVDLSNLEIVLRSDGGGSLKRCTPQKDGAYRLEDLAPGSYRVITNWSRGRNHYTYLARDSTDLIVLKDDEPIATRDLRFDTGGHIWLRVKSPRLPESSWDEHATEDQARVLKASRAEIRDAKGSVVWSSLAIDPSVDGLGLSPGDYRVRVTLPDAEPQEKQVTVKAGEGTRVAFEFP
jgi:hypothetical protein